MEGYNMWRVLSITLKKMHGSYVRIKISVEHFFFFFFLNQRKISVICLKIAFSIVFVLLTELITRK